MEEVWIYDEDPTNKYELKLRAFLRKVLKHGQIADSSARTLGLFHFLKSRKFQSPDEIYNSVFLDKAKKEHYFSKRDSKKIFGFLTETVIGGASDMEDARPYDKLIWRWVEFVYWVTPTQIQDVVNFVEPYAFPLHTVETDFPGIGEVIGLSVDMAAEVNKNVAKYLQQIPGEFIGPPGAILGYLFSTFFICLNMAIFVARKDLGQAFTQSFALIPIFGMAVQNAAESGDKLLEKVSAKRNKFIGQVREVFPGLADYLNMVLFDPNYSGDTKADAEYWKQKIGEHASSIGSSVDQLRSTLGSKDGFLAAATQKAKDLIQTPEGRTNLLNQVKNVGGKRFSKMGKSKSKWKTQRKSKK
jgi:hypothetical protein